MKKDYPTRKDLYDFEYIIAMQEKCFYSIKYKNRSKPLDLLLFLRM